MTPSGQFMHQTNHLFLFPLALKATACLAAAGLLLYFWIVVLELFLKLGPGLLLFDGPGVPPGPPHPGTGMPINYPLMYPTGPPQNTQIYQGPPPHAGNQQLYSAHYGRERPL